MNERISRWTCDACGHVSEEAATSPVGAPDGWTGVAVNMEAADSSWDHDGWVRYHLCPQCRPEPGSILCPAEVTS